MNTYSIPKPQLNPAAWALAALLAIGLIGLGTAAYIAFSYIGVWWQSLAYALVIELGAIVEALALVRGNRYAIAALAIGLPVSISYNWTQAEQAAALLKVPMPWWQLGALAIGPLSAVFFIALALGRELKEHEKRLQAWAADRQQWQDDQAEREARRLERREARQEKAALEAARKQIEARVETSTLTGGTSTGTSTPLRGSYSDFVELLRSNGKTAHTNAELAERFHVSTRTITEWRGKLQEEQPQPIYSEN